MPRKVNCFYYADHQDPFKKKWFNISGSLISSLLDAYKISKTEILIKRVNVETLFDSILMILSNPDTEGTLMAHLLLSLINIIALDKLPSPHPNIIDSVAKYLKQNVKSQVRLDDVAKQFHISRAHLIHIFKAKYNLTPYDFFLRQKMIIAKELLSDSEMSIQQIAFELAFSDSHHFSITFKKICGQSPKEYRASKRKA